MGNVIYNGVELPDIGTVWTDKVTYPYAYIRLFGPQYTVTLLSTTFYVNASGSRMYWSDSGSGAVYNADINTDTGEIAPWVFERNFTYSRDGWNSGPAEITNIWTSFDIYDMDGVLYRATSEPEMPPEPEYSYDRTAFLSGLAAGLTGKGEPTFAATDTFGKGYLAGAALRKNRVT